MSHTEIQPWTKARSALAVATRQGADESTLDELRRDLRAARLADAIRKTVDAFPPLTTEQREHLAGILNGGTR